MTPAEIVSQELAGNMKIKVVENPSLGRGKTDFCAGIWSCHGDLSMRLISARGPTKKAAREALDARLLAVAEKIVGEQPVGSKA